MEHMTSSPQLEGPRVPIHRRPLRDVDILNGAKLHDIWQRPGTAAQYWKFQIHLKLWNLEFCCFHKLVSTLSLFPTTTDLDVIYCTWGLQKCTECAGLPPYPNALRFLSKLVVQVDASVSPVPLAEYLVSGYDRRRIKMAQWTFHFEAQTGRNRHPHVADEFNKTLRILGSTVTDIDIIPYCCISDSTSRISQALDLSHNTRLVHINLQNIVPGDCPEDLIGGILSTISCETRPHVDIRFHLDSVDDNTPWDAINFKALYDFVSTCKVTLGLSGSVYDPRFDTELEGTLDLSRNTAFRTAIVTALGSEHNCRKFQRRLEYA